MHKCIIWPQDLPDNSVVSLSGRDKYVPSAQIAAHLRQLKPSVKVLVWKEALHGTFQYRPDLLRELCAHTLCWNTEKRE
jgi:hypothetical protein